MKYNVKVWWERNSTEKFTDNKYSREHTWMFDGGVELSASSSPQVVPVPMSKESAVDPEEAFVASLSSCHMLFFLSVAARKNLVVDRYEDIAEGILGENEDGETAVTSVNLNPQIVFSGSNIPTPDQITKIHRLAHTKCFIANSVRSEITITDD